MRLFYVNKKLAPLITTLLAIGLMAIIYLFIYIPRHEKMIRDQRFCVLQNIEKNIHEKIKNSVALLNNLLTAYERPAVIQSNEKFDSVAIDKYIARTPGDNFTFIPHSRLKKTDSIDNVYTVKIDEKAKQIVLQYGKQYANQIGTAHFIGMKFSFDQFITSLLPDNVFDDYIIFSNGKTVYQSFPAGVSHVIGDSLLGLKNGISASSIRDVSIGGQDYKLFLQPVQFTSETEWVVGGLLADKSYQAERKKLPSPVILLLITLAFVLVVATPWIKLFHMGSQDTLTVVDGAFSILVSMLLVSILFLSFFKYNLPFRTDNSPDSKKNLANTISIAFEKEIDSITKKLIRYNTLLKKRPELAQDIICKNGIFRNWADTSVRVDSLLPLADDSSINHLFWLKSNGDEIFKWTRDSLMPPHANYRAREYFKNIKDGKTYSLKSLNDTTKFYLDQIMSWTSGGFTSILSIPYSNENKDTVVAAVSFNVQSLLNAILPTGYQFAVINKNGDVLYHSQSSHNLNENLLERFSASNELRSCLNSHAEGVFSTDYLSGKYNVKAKPLLDLPYFIVILSHTAFRQTRDLEVYSFTFTMMVLFFAFLIIEMLVIFFGSAKRSFLKKQLFDTNWLGPKRSGHADYLLSTAFNLVVAVGLMKIFFSPSFLAYGIILLFSASFLTLFLNFLYYIRYKATNSVKYVYKKTAIGILVAVILIIDYAGFRMLEPTNFRLVLLYEISLIVLGGLILLMRRNYFRKWKDQHDVLNYSKFLKVINKLAFVRNDKNYINSFTLMVLTRLLITSGIPVVFFYIGCYNYEQNLLIRYKQSEFASQLIDRLPSDSLKASQVIIRKPAIYNDGAWIKNFELQSVEHKGGYSKEDSDAITLLSTFRLDATPEAVREEKFYVMNSADSLFSYTPITNDAKTKHTETVMYAKTNIPGILLKLTSTGLNYNFPSLLHCRGTPFWLLLFAALVLFFLLLRTIIKKLFAIKIPDLSRFQQLDNAIVLDDDLNNLLFVLGPPGAKKKDYIFEHLVKQANELRPDDTKLKYEKGKPWDNNVFIADLFNIPDSKDNQEEMSDWQRYRKQALDEKNKMVIVNHFEYNLEDQFTNRIKLNFLESLMMREEPKIIIISTIHPMAFLDSIFFEGKKKRGDSEKHHSSISREDLERWNVLLGHFRIVLLPIESLAESEPLVITADEIELNSEQDDKDATSYSWTILSGPVNAAHAVKFKPPDKASTRVTNLVEGVYEFQVKVTLTNSEVIIEKKKVAVHGLTYGETQRAAFVNKMREKAIAIAQYNYEHEKDFDPDELAFKLQFTSQYHYMYIWQSLTKEEKFLLYDLAEDNLVNSFDAHNLSMLIGKGIIYRDKDDTLKIFNKGFRNFILTAIGNSEAMKIKDQIRETGNWGKWRTPLIIILISILLFLIISQEGAYSKLITYVGALGAGIPVFLRLISLFDRSSQKGS